ncbi:MAG: phage tail protein [Myxococcales bacterium]|nr:phage tail protein [Myxococcales bacterium]MBP6843834.1 phage tail protein [Kofleriaceae bacterium]
MPSPTVSTPLYSSAQFLLELDGGKVTTVRSIEGGKISTEIITYQNNRKPSEGNYLKQNGKLKYEAIKVVAPMAASQDMWSWMETFIKGTCQRRNGALVAADHEYKEKARRTFSDAIIEEIAFPKFDASDKNPANVTVTIQPEILVYEAPKDGAVISPEDPGMQRAQHVKCCNFKFHFEGAPGEYRVTKVDGFSVKAKTIDYHHAGRLEPLKIPGKLEFPNITFYVPEPDAAYFIKVAGDLRKGIRPEPTNAWITYFDSAKQDKGEIKFHGCRIFSATQDKLDAANEDVRSVKVEMAVESVEVSSIG